MAFSSPLDPGHNRNQLGGAHRTKPDLHILQEEHERSPLALALSGSKAAAWQLDLQKQELSWTSEFSNLFFYSVDVLQQPFHQWLLRIHPDDREGILAAITQVSQQHQSDWICDYRIEPVGQSLRWIKSFGELYFDEEAQPRWIVGVAYDITSDKMQEMTSQRMLAFAQRILESNQDCIKVLDLKGRLLYLNEPGQALMEIDNFETKVKHSVWFDFWNGGDRDAALQAFGVALAGGTGKFDGYCATAKGTPKWWEVIVSPIRDAQGKISEILSASRDITDRKVTELSLRERNRELDTFARVASHDLKAPLRGIASLSEWIQEDLVGQVSEETDHRLTLMQRSVKQMESLINALLRYARTGRQTLEAEWVNLDGLLQEIIESLAIPEGFQVILPTSLPTLFTRRLLLSQVLTNLISNAVKHHDRESGTVEISAQRCVEGYQFSIADDGPGIPLANRDQVFDIFQTLNNDGKSHESTENTGIGLALVKKIVLAEGGKLSLEENTPRGCRFCFTWLLVPLSTRPDAPEKKHEDKISSVL